MAKIYGDEKGDKFQWEKIKNEPLKVKLDYIITYYGILIAVVILLIIFGVSLTRSIIKNSVPKVISGEIYTYDTDSPPSVALKTYLCNKLDLDESKYDIDLYASALNSDDYQQYLIQLQKIMARITAADLDFIIGEPEFLIGFMDKEEADHSAFQDLSKSLPEDLYKKLEEDDLLIYFEAEDTTIPYAIKLNDTKLATFFDLPLVDFYLVEAVKAPHPEAFIALVEILY